MAINRTPALKGRGSLNKIERQNQKGMTLVELLIVIAIITIGLVYLLGMFSFSFRIAGGEKRIIQANLTAQEVMEGVRNFRDGTNWEENGLGALATSSPYHLEENGSPPEWTLVSGEKTTDGFTQKIVFDDVQRDLNNNIVENGGTIDPDTKKATISVTWIERGKSQQVELTTFFTNWKQ